MWNLVELDKLIAKTKLFYRFSNVDFNTLIWYKPNGKIPSHFCFHLYLGTELKRMKIFYYALNLELYKICTKLVHDKFQLVMSFPDIGLCSCWTLGICTKIVSRSQMSSVHKHYHFKYYYLLPQWLYFHSFWGLGEHFYYNLILLCKFHIYLLYLKTALL